MKNILIPTDFSDNSWNALNYAITFFKDIQCHFYIIHVGKLYASGIESNSILILPEIEKKDFLEKKASFLAKIETLKITKNQKLSSFESYGNFIDTIRKIIVKKNIHLIVMGTKGASGVKKVIGSNTGDVITKVPCNLLVIPEKINFSEIKNIVLPSDYTIFYSHAILEVISEILHTTKAHLNVVNFFKSKKNTNLFQEQNKAYLKDYLEELFDNSHTFKTVTNKKIKTVVEEFTANKKIDMVIIPAKNLNFLEQLLFNSAATYLSFHTQVPLLVIHE